MIHYPPNKCAGPVGLLALFFLIPLSSQSAEFPSSPVIQGIDWSPPSEILRLANGSDNWPLTWASDDTLYAAYGDGNGFKPYVKEKLSLGLARIEGHPSSLKATNLRSPSVEAIGHGATARKASGLICVDGVLYLLARNLENSQLAWSTDLGKNWIWAEWKFETSFGAPSFLQFGKDYSGARDSFVYIYSQDSDSAYQRADGMVLARVPKDELQNRSAYEFFQGLNQNDDPQWTREIDERGWVFERAGACYRSHVSFHPGTQRYLWCQTGLGEDTRYTGGFAIYDAPEPWGPWTEVLSTDQWDVGPGESSSFPPKWMGDDGLTLYLVFSGNDGFSVRRGKLRLPN